MTRLQPAFRRGELSHNHPEQGSLSHTVWTHDADSFSPLDIQTDIFKEQLFLLSPSEFLGKALSRDYIVSRLKVLLEMNLHSACFAFRTLPPFYIREPLFSGLCPLNKFLGVVLFHAAYHLFLTGDFTLLIVIGPQFRLSALAFLGGKGGVIAFVAIDFVVFHLKNSVDRPVQKISVVGYDHNGSFI